MKFVVIGDVHLADRPPSVRTETYTQDILDKLAFCVAQGREAGCDAVVLLGDVFHIKSPSRTSHALVQSAHEVLTKGDIPVRVVVGNHDIKEDRLDSLPSQPLGSLSRMSGVEILMGADPDFPLYGIPYLQDWSQLPQWLSEFTEHQSKNKTKGYTLLGMHAPIFPDKKQPPYEYLPASSVADLAPARTHIAYGHIHDPEGVWSPNAKRKVTVANFGAISRGSLHAETLKRQPQAYIWDSEINECAAFDIPVRPVEEVFNLAPVEIEKTHRERVTSFLDSLGAEKNSVSSIESMTEQLGTLIDSQEGDVARLARELVEFAQESRA